MNNLRAVLDYLVTSPSRRRLLVVLWVELGSGSASELARQARVSFATAYRELRAMARHALVEVTVEAGVARYAANTQHPLAATFRELVAYRPVLSASPADERVRAELAELGAPVRSEAEVPAPADLEQTVVRGAELARRDPATARAMPVLLHKLRARLDPARLERLAREHGTTHTLGFLCALTTKLGGDARLAALARELRDHRVRDQPFFVTATRRAPATFPLARRWGFRMSTDEETFASTFRRFAEIST